MFTAALLYQPPTPSPPFLRQQLGVKKHMVVVKERIKKQLFSPNNDCHGCLAAAMAVILGEKSSVDLKKKKDGKVNFKKKAEWPRNANVKKRKKKWPRSADLEKKKRAARQLKKKTRTRVPRSASRVFPRFLLGKKTSKCEKWAVF